MTAGTSRFAASWLGAAALLGALVLLPAAALAVPFELTVVTGGCSPAVTNPAFQASCVSIDSSASWPDPTSLNIDFDPPVGNLQDFVITNLEIPTLASSGVTDIFSPSPSSVEGTLDTSDGSIVLSFEVHINRNGADRVPFTYSMTTGSTGVVGCNGTDFPALSGSNLGDGTNPNEVYIVGLQCVNLVPATGGSDEFTIMAMSYKGTMVPEPSTLLLLGTGLTALAYRRRRA